MQCSAVSQSGNQSDTHTALSAADGSWEPLDCQSPSELTKSKFGSGPFCGCAHAPIAPTALSPHPNVDPLDNRRNEGEEGNDSQLHACEELPEIIAAIYSDRSRLDSVDTVPSLVDDDTSSGEESDVESRQTDRQYTHTVETDW